MSCRRSSRPRRAAAGGCARPSGAWRQRARARGRGRSRVSRPKRLARGQAPAGGGAVDARCRAERGLRGLPGARADDATAGGFGRPPPKPYTPPAHAGGQDQHHRPGLARRQGAARVGAGLQRAGRHQRAADRDRRRGDDSSAGLRAPGADARRHPPRARRPPASTRLPRCVLADAGYWHQRPDATHRRPTASQVLDPARRQPARKAPGRGWDGGLYAFMRRVLAHRARRRALPPSASR